MQTVNTETLKIQEELIEKVRDIAFDLATDSIKLRNEAVKFDEALMLGELGMEPDTKLAHNIATGRELLQATSEMAKAAGIASVIVELAAKEGIEKAHKN